MFLYNYNQYGEFVCKSELEYDPIDNLPLIPAFSTLIEPILKQGFVSIFKVDKWELKEIEIEIPNQPFEWSYWNNNTKKWEEDIVKKTEYNNTEYQRLRKAEYDKLNQDEMRFDDLVNGTTTWQDAIIAIKNKYPKPE